MLISQSLCRTLAAVGLFALAGAVSPALAQSATSNPPVPLVDKDIHMGIATCAGSTCHGAVESWQGVQVLQNEFITWQRKDQHAKAYQVLLNEQSQRIARNLGLENAHTADICLDCHADNVPQERRHRTFQITDGVTCEACHGGAGRWIGSHIAANATHQQNIANGLYPTAAPDTRAKLCLSCHFGDETRFVTHRIMGAGHPRMGFELDTFTALQPAHYEVDADYRRRKGTWNGVQVWAIGQAMALQKLVDAVLDPEMGKDGVFPELVLFDCYSCHRSLNAQRWEPRSTIGLGPGIPRLNDANMLMLMIITSHVDEAMGDQLRSRVLAVHAAVRKDYNALLEEAEALKGVVDQLVDKFSDHKFGKEDMKALMDGVVAWGLDGNYTDYPGAEQATMALGTIVNAMRDTGAIDRAQADAFGKALEGLYAATSSDEGYEHAKFVGALQDFKAQMPQL